MRYLLFAGDRYYPLGGWDDFKGSFDTLEAALAHVHGPNFGRQDWWHVVDYVTGNVVQSGGL